MSREGETDAIELRDLRVMAYCGVLPEEAARRQPFSIDVDVHLDLTRASETDDLRDTVDYGTLIAQIVELASANHYALLERFAAEISRVALADPRATSTDVTVRKLRPPVPQDLGSSGVRIRREAG